MRELSLKNSSATSRTLFWFVTSIALMLIFDVSKFCAKVVCADSSAVSLTSVSTTCAPLSSKAAACSIPNRPAAPVMSAVFPLRLNFSKAIYMVIPKI